MSSIWGRAADSEQHLGRYVPLFVSLLLRNKGFVSQKEHDAAERGRFHPGTERSVDLRGCQETFIILWVQVKNSPFISRSEQNSRRTDVNQRNCDFCKKPEWQLRAEHSSSDEEADAEFFFKAKTRWTLAKS